MITVASTLAEKKPLGLGSEEVKDGGRFTRASQEEYERICGTVSCEASMVTRQDRNKGFAKPLGQSDAATRNKVPVVDIRTLPGKASPHGDKVCRP